MRSRTVTGVALTVLGALVGAAACSGPGGPPKGAVDAASGFASAWSAGKALSTVDPRTAAAATRDIEAAGKDLGIRATTVRPQGAPVCLDGEEAKKINPGGGVCNQPLAVSQEVSGIGTWRYTSTAQVRQDAGGKWRVWWTPATFHPELTATTELHRERTLPPRASILDDAGKPLTKDTPVVRVGVEPRRVQPDVTYAQLQQILDIDAAALRQRAEAADPTHFVDVLTLREPAYEEVRVRLDDVPGVVTRDDTMSLAPSSTYARGVLGVVAPATAESLKKAGPQASASDEIGASGLQEAYQTQLAGTPGGQVDLVDKKDGHKVATLYTQAAKPGKPLRTTIDPRVQEAAETAVQGQAKPTALVAVRASTGEVLAAANGPGVTSYNRAFVGQYPPGSTFKVVSVSALLKGGLKPSDPATCPARTTVGGKMFKNAYDTVLPDGPFTEAFAHSCNTTVVEHADDITNSDFVEMARTYGIGETWKLGVPAYSGSVPEPADLTDRAASMIGQGRVLMSPLGMAMVAAAVDSGQPRKPVLLPDVAPGGTVGKKLPASLTTAMRGLMRSVVTTGSATTLNLPGLPVHAKTGTAEYGSDNPPRTHAWMIGYRGDIAFALVIEDGGAGGADAGPVAKQFLQGVGSVRLPPA